MKIYKTDKGIVLESEGNLYAYKQDSWDHIFYQENIYKTLQAEISGMKKLGGSASLKDLIMQAPIKSQEIWAAGVTYTRSRDARMEESKDAG